MTGVTPIVASGWLTAALALGWQWLAHARRAALVAEAAHEVRGPLCAARLALHGASADPGRVAAAERELRRAGRAVDDLTLASRGRLAPDRPEWLDAGAVAAEVVLGAGPVARGFGAGLRLDRPRGAAPVRADRLRLAQAVANLVANAAEHGTGDVVVRVRADRAHVWIAVRDGGPGPSPARVAAAARRAGRARGPLRSTRHAAGGTRHAPRTAATAWRRFPGNAATGTPADRHVRAGLGRDVSGWGGAAGARGHGLAIAAGIAARAGGRLTTAPGGWVVLELPRGAAEVASRRAGARAHRRPAGSDRLARRGGPSRRAGGP